MTDEPLPVVPEARQIAWPLLRRRRRQATSDVADEVAAGVDGGRERSEIRWLAAVSRLLLVGVALWSFVIALNLIKSGAGGLKPLLNSLSAGGVLGHLGFGWLGSYVVLSGSPIAAVSLSLFAGGGQSDTEAFAMINGSRLGSSSWSAFSPTSGAGAARTAFT